MKNQEYSRRSELFSNYGKLSLVPVCPICGQPVYNPDMHEGIITRAQAVGSALYTRIFVPMNISLVHPGLCHIDAQHSVLGRRRIVEDIVKHNGLDKVLRWLREDMADLAYAREAERFVLDIIEEG